MPEPQRFGNAEEIALTATERRDLILAVLTYARNWMDLYGRYPSVQEIEALLTGQKSL